MATMHKLISYGWGRDRQPDAPAQVHAHTGQRRDVAEVSKRGSWASEFASESAIRLFMSTSSVHTPQESARSVDGRDTLATILKHSGIMERDTPK